MPNVLQKHGTPQCKQFFMWAYQTSSPNGSFQLDVNQVKHCTGICRTHLYRIVSFLVRCNLLAVVERKTGRGKHSVFRLNWRKSAKKCSPIVKTNKDLHSLRNDESRKNPCNLKAALSTSKENQPSSLFFENGESQLTGISLRSQTATSNKPTPKSRNTTPKFQVDLRFHVGTSNWAHMMSAFRKLLFRSWLLPVEQHWCLKVLGRYLKSKPVDFARRLYHAMERYIQFIDVPARVTTIRHLCAWWMWTLKRLVSNEKVSALGI